MKLLDYKIRLSVVRMGYGHWLVHYSCGNGCDYAGTTDNSMLIDAYNDSETCTISVCKELARVARNGGKL